MMQYRVVRDAIVQLLEDGAQGRFRVLNRRTMSKSADEIAGNNRLVCVYYDEGTFPRQSARQYGPKKHECMFQIELSASAGATADLSVLESSTATQAQKAAAIAAIKEASEVADESIDDMIEAVLGILFDARNEGLQLVKGTIASRWIERLQKDTLLERGDLVVRTASMRYTCTVVESVDGDIGNEPPTVTFDTEIVIPDDSKTGVTVTNDN